MRSLLLRGLFLVVVLAGAAEGAAAVPPLGHTRLQAERNILRSVRLLARWKTPFVDTRYNTIRSNTRVSCSGSGRRIAGTYRAFICTITYRGYQLQVRYVAFDGNGFGLRRLTATHR